MPQTITIRDRGKTEVSLARRVLDAVRSYTVAPMSLKDPALARLFGAGYQTAAGIPVTDENLWTFSAVYDAVNQSSSDLAKLPLSLRKRNGNGGSDPFEASKTFWLLKHEANRDMSAFEFRRTLQAHALTCKGAFAEIERDTVGRPLALWPLTPDRVTPFLQNDKLPTGRYRSRLRYRIDGDNKNIIEAENILHIRGLGYDGYCAYPVIDKARQAIGLALAAERFASAFFGNNSNLGGVLAADQELDTAQAKEVQDRIEQVHKGPDRAWRLLVLGAGFKYFRTGVTPSESQMNDIRSKQVEEVARFFNMPLHKLKSLDRATNNNIEQQDLEYYKGHQLNWITNWEAELDRKLIPSLEIGNQFFKHNANAALRADAAGRTAFYNAMLDRGVFCADDVLELEDMNPQPNGQGKLYLVQGAMVPKDTIVDFAKGRIDLMDAQIEKMKQPPPAPAAPPVAPTQEEVNAANARADAADAAATELRVAAQVERDARIAAEATGTATAAELTALREAEQRASVLATQATALAETMRADVEAERRRAAAAEEARDASAAAAREEQEQRTAAEARATAAESEQVRLAAAAQEAETRVAAARLEAEHASQRATEAAATAQSVADDRAGVEAARAAAQASLDTATAALAAATAERDTARAAAALATNDAVASRAEADRLLAEALGRQTEAEARAAGADAARIAAEALAEAARARQVELQQESVAAVAERDAAALRAAVGAEALETATRQAETALAAETEQRTAIEARLSVLEQELAITVAERDAQTAAAVEQRRLAEEADRSAVAGREQLATVTAALADVRGVSEASLSALQAGVAALERDRDEARSLAATQEARATDSAALATEREAELRTVRQADADAMSGIIAAHRGLVVEIMRKAVERETDRARRAQQTPEKLRHWLDTFYEGHAELMRQALLPAMRVHLAFVRSTEDPIEATRRYVATHVADSERQIRTVLDGDAEALAASLPALLHRWDTERPTALADVLMTKELNYARRL